MDGINEHQLMEAEGVMSPVITHAPFEQELA